MGYVVGVGVVSGPRRVGVVAGRGFGECLFGLQVVCGVLLGRAFVYAMAVGGQSAVEQLLAILEKDMRTNMVLTGVKSVKDIGPHLLAQ